MVEANSQRPTAGRYCIFIRRLRHPIPLPPPFCSSLQRRLNLEEELTTMRLSPAAYNPSVICLPVSEFRFNCSNGGIFIGVTLQIGYSYSRVDFFNIYQRREVISKFDTTLFASELTPSVCVNFCDDGC